MHAWHRLSTILTLALALALATTLLTACGDDSSDESPDGGDTMTGDGDGDGDATPDPIEVVGSWENQYGGTEVITEQDWDFTFMVGELVEWDNDENWAVVYYPVDDDDDTMADDTYDRIVWTEPEDGVFYYCTVEFSLSSKEEALESDAEADDSDPENGGCGVSDFAWNMMTQVDE